MPKITIAALVLCALIASCSGDGGALVEETSTTRAPITTLPPPPPDTTTSTTTTTLPPAPPSVTVTPSASSIVDTYATSVEVASDPGVVITISDEDIVVDQSGTVSWPVLSSPGENIIPLTATSEDGLSTAVDVAYRFEPQSGWAVAIGDSVMLGTQPEIEKRVPLVAVDATVSRQFSAAPAMVRDFVAREKPPELIIIGLGSNGPARSSDFDAIMEAASDVPLVAFVNVRVPRTWEDTSNSVIADGVARYDNAVLVDWYSASWDQDELFAGDGVHPKQPGRVILAELIAEAVFPLGPPPPVEDS